MLHHSSYVHETPYPSTSRPSSFVGLISELVSKFDVPTYPTEILFLGGAPGSGKGTNSAHISALRGYDAPSIVMSDLLNTLECQLLKAQGVLVDDEFAFAALSKELKKYKYRNGVVVDGFPRTAKQAELLKEFYSDHCHEEVRMVFVMLHVDETTSIARQLSRGQAAIAAHVSEVRATDLTINASKARYSVFSQQMKAVETLGRLFPLIVVDASAPVEQVRETLADKMTCLM